ncbi:GNAT family N-acetyltransferase [Akkermansiaceae bacterium]|nr:GNAT family N-acetyltransferase [Akkermansiaceae bacterium]
MTQAGTFNQHFIRLAQTGDVRAISRIHQRALESSFLAKLGAGFLAQMYGYLIDREIVFLVMAGDRPAGFVSASVNPSGMMKRFVLNRPLCLVRIGLAVLRRPVFLKGVLETVRAPSRPEGVGTDAEAESGVMAELLSIAIDREHHRKGFASKLLTAMEGELKSRGVDCYKVVAGDKLDGANRFYRNSGFRLAGQIAIHGNDISNIYTKEI